MIKFINKILIFLFFSFILYVFLSNPSLIINSVNYSVEVFLKNVLPSLFPFFILADFLINYNYIYFLNKIFKFKYSYIILLSLFSGLPSNAKYISSLLEKNEITKKDAEIILSVTFFPNPMFVIGSIGVLMLNNLKVGIFLLINIYISNIILYLTYYKKLTYKKIILKKDTPNFTTTIKNSITNNTKTLIIILGTIVIFTTLSNIIFNYLNLKDPLEALLTSTFEMTSGIKKISVLNSSLTLKMILISLALAFSGISVLCQAFSILNEYNLNIKFILLNKIKIILLTLLTDYIYIIFFL